MSGHPVSVARVLRRFYAVGLFAARGFVLDRRPHVRNCRRIYWGLRMPNCGCNCVQVIEPAQSSWRLEIKHTGNRI
jgi:hypothetical protein